MTALIQLKNLEKAYDLAGGKYFVLRRISWRFSRASS